jgi:serine/threonine protein kinase
VHARRFVGAKSTCWFRRGSCLFTHLIFSHSAISTLYTLYDSHGYWRDAWLFNSTSSLSSSAEEFAYKRLRLNEDISVTYDTIYKVGREAVIMEQLTHSPRIVNIFGFCSTTVMSEAMDSEVWQDIIPGTGRTTQAKLDKVQQQVGGVQSKNNFTATEKLYMALEMSEALADMHGFAGGVIIHGDTHPEQWLRDKEGKLRLNDFNNGVILDYDPEQQMYCKGNRKYGGFVSYFQYNNKLVCLLVPAAWRWITVVLKEKKPYTVNMYYHPIIY